MRVFAVAMFFLGTLIGAGYAEEPRIFPTYGVTGSLGAYTSHSPNELVRLDSATGGANELAAGLESVTRRTMPIGGDKRQPVEWLEPVGAINPVLYWNRVMLETIRLDSSDPVEASRALAIESVAVFDVLNAIEGTPAFLVRLDPPEDIRLDAAVTGAAHRVLIYLFPGHAAVLDAALRDSLAAVPDGAAEDDGLAFGTALADAIIAIRNSDNWDASVVDNGSVEPGTWRPTAPKFAPALAPQWGSLTPFGLTSGGQFRPDGPPALDSAEYAAAYEEVLLLGSATSTLRTEEQTEIARFWADGPGTYTPAGHWNAIAARLAADTQTGVPASARLLAMLNVALADAGVAAWDAKFTYGFWRPITAIQFADADGNPSTVMDPNWTPLLVSPPFPEYVSGHSTYSAAAAVILTGMFGDVPFTTTSVGLPGVERRFESFFDAADEAGLSRIYGGIHFAFSNEAGRELGTAVGKLVEQQFADQLVR